MIRNISCLVLISFITFSSLLATGDENGYLAKDDSIFIQLDVKHKKVFYHTIEKKQTLFGLSQFYGLEVAKVYQLNPHIQNNVMGIGEQIMIPIPDEAIMSDKRKRSKSKFVPVIYKVRPKDNLFRIARVYFDIQMDDFKKMNKLKSNDLKIGMELLVGWIDMQGIAKDLQSPSGEILSEKLLASRPKEMEEKMDKQTEEVVDPEKEEILIPEEKKEEVVLVKEKTKAKPSKPKVFIQERGIAFWNKSLESAGKPIVLHKSAPINSIIEITNPMFNRTVHAKVVGHIPPKAYTDDITLVISPVVAKNLGAMDPRFYVKIRYQK